MKTLFKIITLAIAMLLLPAYAEKAPKTPPAIAKDAKHPAGVDLKLMSDDASYGYTEKNPIKVGSKEEYGGPQAERDYLESLLDTAGKPLKFRRLGSGGASAEGKPLDIYEITLSDGGKFQLWIDMYQPKNKPDKQPAPLGLYKKK